MDKSQEREIIEHVVQQCTTSGIIPERQLFSIPIDRDCYARLVLIATMANISVIEAAEYALRAGAFRRTPEVDGIAAQPNAE